MSNYRKEKHLQTLTPSAAERIRRKAEDYVVMDPNTGEIIEHYEPSPVFSDSQKKAFHDNSELAFFAKENDGFILAFYEFGQSIFEQYGEKFTSADLARIHFIATYQNYKDNYLRFDNQHYIDEKALKGLLKLSRNRFPEFYKKLIDNKILTEEGDKLMMNTEYFYRGETRKVRRTGQNVQHMRLFRKAIRELYGEFTGKKTGQLGLLYAVMPFVNFRCNIISHNPGESVSDYVKPMRLGELAEKVGYKDVKKLRAAMRGIRVNNQPAFQFVEDEADLRSRKIIVNPRIMFASNNEALEAIKALFND
ncbi:hypothetical protein [Rossellomorea aquimaris]|uniref:hypothetical protein n=1 Tax=Rossellomorea aquimaris TaxID=189382 RepID=UPI001CFF497C|nr:hypothetical protein [Rossellomorea aquimaris]